MYKTPESPTSPPPTPSPLTLPRSSGEILPVTTPIETLPTKITRQEQPEQTVVNFPISAGDHFLVMMRAPRNFWKLLENPWRPARSEYITFADIRGE